jgi:hypothetical protein
VGVRPRSLRTPRLLRSSPSASQAPHICCTASSLIAFDYHRCLTLPGVGRHGSRVDGSFPLLDANSDIRKPGRPAPHVRGKMERRRRVVARAGEVLENPITGQRMIVRKTAVYTKPSSSRPPAQYHPHQEERFEVLSGRLLGYRASYPGYSGQSPAPARASSGSSRRCSPWLE